MIQYLMKKYALTQQGAKDFLKATVHFILSNLLLMLPASLLFLLVQDLISGYIPTSHYYILSLGIFGILVLMFVVYYFEYNCSFFLTYKESGKRRIQLAERLRKLPLSFFAHKDLTDMTNVILNDATALEQSFSHFMPSFFGSMISTIIIAIPIIIIDWRMAIASLWVLPVAIIIVACSKKAQNYFNKKKNDSVLDLHDKVQECIDDMKDIRSSNYQDSYLQKVKINIRDVEKKQIKSELGVALFVVSAQMILKFGIATTALAGAIFLVDGSLPIMTFFLFLLLISRLYEPMASALQNLAAINSTYLNIERMKEFYRVSIQDGTKDFHPKNYNVEFKNVDFSYNENEGVLHQVSFVAKQGEVTALVGPSGCGKSTISKLCARFWDVNKGKIELGGENICQIDPETLMNNFSIVFQDVNLFNNTILENIRIGKKDASDEEVIAAAKMANCDEFVLKLKDQYHTFIGENGTELSGGERQRISIARALLKDAPIILLDEATASLDAENETIIQEAISKVTKNKTVIVIAHRMRTVENANHIIVLKEGKIIEEGKPTDLIQKQKEFAKMVQLQKESSSWSI